MGVAMRGFSRHQGGIFRQPAEAIHCGLKREEIFGELGKRRLPSLRVLRRRLRQDVTLLWQIGEQLCHPQQDI